MEDFRNLFLETPTVQQQMNNLGYIDIIDYYLAM
jgi:hypothetical protein